MKRFLPNSKGFTLIELLVALTIVTILAVAVYAALNPAQRLKDSKDARRATDVETILTAVHQSIIDNKGTLPTNLQALAVDTEAQLGSAATGCTQSADCTTGTACVDLIADVAQDLKPYLAAMPIDPGGTAVGADATKTGYSVKRDTNGIITVKACYTDQTATIQSSR